MAHKAFIDKMDAVLESLSLEISRWIGGYEPPPVETLMDVHKRKARPSLTFYFAIGLPAFTPLARKHFGTFSLTRKGKNWKENSPAVAYAS